MDILHNNDIHVNVKAFTNPSRYACSESANARRRIAAAVQAPYRPFRAEGRPWLGVPAAGPAETANLRKTFVDRILRGPTWGTVGAEKGRYQGVMRRTCISFGRSALAILGAVGSLTLAGPATSRADGLMPGLTLQTRYDHEQTGVPPPPGQWTQSITPQILFERAGVLTTWDVRAERRYDNPEQVSGFVVGHDIVTGTVHSTWGEHTHSNIEGSYFESRDVFNPDPRSPISGSRQWHSYGTADFESYRGEASYYFDFANYQETKLEDGHSQSLDAALYPFRTPSNRWLVAAHHEEWTVADRNQLITTTATAGLRRDHTPTLSSHFEVGVARIDEDGALRNDLALVAGLKGFGSALGLPFDARFEVRHDVTNSGVAEIWRSVPGKLISLRWEKALAATGGYFDEPTNDDFVTFTAQDTLGGRSIVSLEGSYRRDRPRSLNAERLETYRAAAAFSKDLQPWLRATARYSLAVQHATAGVGAYPFDRDRVELMLTAAYQ